MRFAVTGGRDYQKGDTIADALAELPRSAVMVNGGCPTGLDAVAARWWHWSWGRDIETYPADWVTHGKAAGPVRNQLMVDSGLDLLVAFPGGRGTADMVRRCREAGIEVADVCGVWGGQDD